MDPFQTPYVAPQVDPNAVANRVLTLRSAMQGQQLQQQQIQAAQMENQQRSIALQDQQAMTQAMHQWDGRSGDQLLDLARKNGASANKIFELQTTVLNHRKELGQADEVDLKNRATRADGMQSLFSSLRDVTDPTQQSAMWDQNMRQAIRQGLTTSQEAALHPYPGPQGIVPYLKSLDYEKYTLAEQQKSRADQAAAAAAKDNAELPGINADADQKQRASLSAQLANAPDAKTYGQILENAPLKYARQFPPAAQWNAQQTPALARRVGLNSEQATTADQATATLNETKNRDAQTARSENTRNNIAAGELDMRRKTFNATIGAGLDANGQPINDAAMKKWAESDPVAKQIANYQLPPANTRTALGQATMRKVAVLNSDYQAQYFQTFQKTENDATTGSIASQAGALNTMMGHLTTLNKAAALLDNSDLPALNKIANFVGVQTGNDPVTVYRTILHRLGPEITKAYVAGGGTSGERGTNEEDFDDALGARQIKSNIGISAHLADSKIGALQDQYNRGTYGRGRQKLISDVADQARRTLTQQAPESLRGAQLPSGGGKVLDDATARQFLEAAGGDKAKARQLAQQNNWKLGQ